MKTLRTYSTLAALVAMLAVTSFVRASDGGKGASPNSGPGSANSGNTNAAQVRLRTNLAGASITGKKPEGNADFRSETGRMRLNVEVENLNLPDGTVLTVAITHAGSTTTAGMITLTAMEGELELDSQHGDTVPAVASGDMITVSNGAAVVLAGAY